MINIALTFCLGAMGMLSVVATVVIVNRFWRRKPHKLSGEISEVKFEIEKTNDWLREVCRKMDEAIRALT